MDTKDTPIYNIKAVARLTGVAADTLRRWESRYAILTPQRSNGGYRMYSQRDVETIRWLKARVDEGLSISRASELLRSQNGHTTTPITRLERPEPLLEDSEQAHALPRLKQDILNSLEKLDEGHAGQLLNEGLALFSVEQVLEYVIQPLLVEVGELWVRGDWTVAQEHFASAFVRGRLANMIHSSPFRHEGPLVLVACAPHELHEIGPLVLALFLRRAGFRVIYLGQNVPVESLVRMATDLKPKAICISATRTETGAQLVELQKAFEKLQSEGDAPLLAYGGSLFNRNPGLAERLGGHYLGASAHEAVELLDRMVA